MTTMSHLNFPRAKSLQLDHNDASKSAVSIGFKANVGRNLTLDNDIAQLPLLGLLTQIIILLHFHYKFY